MGKNVCWEMCVVARTYYLARQIADTKSEIWNGSFGDLNEMLVYNFRQILQ